MKATDERTFRHSEFELPITYSFGTDHEGEGGWINGCVHLPDGGTISVGGGWVEQSGEVTPYQVGDMGDIDGLMEYLGYRKIREDHGPHNIDYDWLLWRDDVMASLSDACPDKWNEDEEAP